MHRLSQLTFMYVDDSNVHSDWQRNVLNLFEILISRQLNLSSEGSLRKIVKLFQENIYLQYCFKKWLRFGSKNVFVKLHIGFSAVFHTVFVERAHISSHWAWFVWWIGVCTYCKQLKRAKFSRGPIAIKCNLIISVISPRRPKYHKFLPKRSV